MLVHGPTEKDEPAILQSHRTHAPKRGMVIDGRYRVERLLGHGGMGSVVAAMHLGIGRRVSIKIMKLSGKHAAVRFAREGRTLAQLNHPHIVRVYDSGQLQSGRPYIVMERLDGADLEQRLRTGPIAVADVVRWIRQACDALAAAHSAGVVHRDLKPSNLFLVRNAKSPFIKVLDFGISKAIHRPGSHLEADGVLTGTGVMMGSPRYMSPEQLRSARDVDARTDIWSLGVIMYELLTGETPFPQRDFPGLANAIATQAPKRTRDLRPEIPGAVENIIQRCLQKDRDRRYPSIAALALALDAYTRRRRWPDLALQATRIQTLRRSPHLWLCLIVA
ncbi:MAG TPA: serine/threonine-protein kinase, partial [Polyangiales bacterium]|nr:serine/threonine-protein kinase [Polyangiales bacterium]